MSKWPYLENTSTTVLDIETIRRARDWLNDPERLKREQEFLEASRKFFRDLAIEKLKEYEDELDT